MKKKSDIKGFLLHASHYDPDWCPSKPKEAPFDLPTARTVVECMARKNMNLLIIDCADGVKYKSHPELKRHYTVPMAVLKEVSDHAHACGIDVVPKLNFSKSGRNQHDQWMVPYSNQIDFLQDYRTYFKIADDLIKELVAICHPKKFFHIGMDEDHYRSMPQYIEAIMKLRKSVSSQGLKTIIWNDSCHHAKDCIAQVHAEKSIHAEALLPKDIIHVLWDYDRAHPSIVRRIVQKGFPVWAAAGSNADNMKKWWKALAQNGGSGVLVTHWIKCCKSNKQKLLTTIKNFGTLGHR